MVLALKHQSQASVILTSFAILVEQGQHNCSSLKGNLSHLFIYGSLIISGILISISYKGDNITRLTLPIVPLPYIWTSYWKTILRLYKLLSLLII